MPALPGCARLGGRGPVARRPRMGGPSGIGAGGTCWRLRAGSGLRPGAVIAYLDNTASQGWISPIAVVLALRASRAAAGPLWGRGSWLASMVVSACVPAPDLGQQLIRRSDPLHPATLARWLCGGHLSRGSDHRDRVRTPGARAARPERSPGSLIFLFPAKRLCASPRLFRSPTRACRCGVERSRRHACSDDASTTRSRFRPARLRPHGHRRAGRNAGKGDWKEPCASRHTPA